ncbi:protein mono-ADP-ribosyltransferase PARP14-like [Dendropsophus ebraccatus]|uniref:protein mono-ADP-ribosyltransferase PARP14-like n=1 Tax=Dendropsophus ebraccatus TaxID=150705 RepID=UPI0038317CD1
MAGGSYRYPVSLQWDEGPESLKKLKNKLLVHFQSKNKSNGGECEIRESPRDGGILICFREEAVKAALTLVTSILPDYQCHFLLQKPRKDERIRSPAAKVARNDQSAEAEHLHTNMVLIENIQDSCTDDILILLIENISDTICDTDFTLERIHEIQSAVVTFNCDIDIFSFIQKFCQNHRVNQQNLTAKPLEETRSIRAEGVPPNTQEDHLVIYFESPKVGGGQVQKAEMFPEEEAALITFSDAQTVKIIMKKEHVISKKSITVYRYYSSLGTALYGKQRPTVEKPQPIQLPISPYLLEFIRKDGRLKQSIEKKMSDKKSEILWPDQSCANPFVTLCFPTSLSSHLRTIAKVAHTWTEEVSTEFSKIISRYKVIDCKMSPLAWEEIREQTSTAAYDGVLIKPNTEAEKVFLAGTMKDVNKIEQSFRKLLEEISRKAERSHNVSTIEEPMSAAFYHIICNSGVEKKILTDVPELKMEYDPSKYRVLFTGLRDEVLQAKCEILSVKQQLISKSIPVDPHVLQFLMFAGNEEVSCLLFARHKINALIEIEENTIKLSGYSRKDLMDGEDQIKRELICQQIPVEHKGLLQSPEWKSLQSHLLDSPTSETCTVLILESPPGAENDVVVAGLSSSVHKSYKEIHEFVEKNTPVQKKIPVKSMAVMQFIKEEKNILDHLKRINVKVVLRNRNMLLIGTKTYVEEAASHVQKILSSLYDDTLRIDKPGAKKFCLANEELYVTTVKNKFRCVLHLQKDGENDETINETSLDGPQYQIQLPQGVTVSVYREDLCRHRADVIVNAANEDLRHVGGLAMAILNAAGPKLQDDCDRIICEQGSLFPGESVITDAGNLPCKQVIHTVGPRWNSNSSQRSKSLLQTAIRSSLALAAEHGHRSIAIPAVSSGIFGFPIPVCAQSIVEAIKEFVQGKGRSSSVTNINLVDTKHETIAAFIKSLKEQFGEQNLTRYQVPNATQIPLQSIDEEATASAMISNQSIMIIIKEGFLQDATTDVIVNSVGRDLHLNSGGASRALYEKAGKQLQVLLTQEGSGAPVLDGATFVTLGCNLSCQIVVHVVVPRWDGGKGSSEQVLRQTMQTCLDTAEKKQLTSITFPAIGTGVLGFPKDVVAALMFDEVLKFSSSSKNQRLQKVIFMLHPKDTETIKEFYREQGARKIRNPVQSRPVSAAASEATQGSGASSDTAFFGAVKTLSLGVHEMQVGPIKYQVKTGDITKEDTDVIVNSTNTSFNSKSGVSKSILEAAGPSVEEECAQLAFQNANKSNHITTRGGNLLCKHIVHVAGTNTEQEIKDFVTTSLQECENLQASSVAFPAIGTGMANVSAALVADTILDVVTEFAKSKSSTCLQMVKVVVFQQKMVNDFYTSMKKMEGSNLPKQTTFLSKVTNWFSYLTPKSEEKKKPKVFKLEESIEPAIFHLCAESKQAVTDTRTWLKDLILKEQGENIITDEWILKFDDQDHHTLSQDQTRLGVSVSFESAGSTVRISGLTRDVLEMSNKIQDMIKKVREKKTKERDADILSDLVEWRYHDGNSFIPFDRIANLDLEKAKNTDMQSLKIDVSGVSYTVKIKENIMQDARGRNIRIDRVSKGPNEMPAHWTPMANSNVAVVPLTSGTQEYNDVEAQFKKSCQMKIIKIERVQYLSLWKTYQIKKQEIDLKNRTTTNEKQLFHGTDSSSLSKVSKGFNRSYAGKNAACYGNGTYFAVNSNYSAQDLYSRPDSNGQKYMYLARVLTGEFCVGTQGMVAPPAKNSSDSTDLYDSVTDNVANPTMFVIFNDIQAYPEYLITFTK